MMFKSFLHNRELNIEVFIIYIKKSIDIVIDFDSGTQRIVFLHNIYICYNIFRISCLPLKVWSTYLRWLLTIVA